MPAPIPELSLLPALALILVVGAAARWLASRLKLPDILLLLLAGIGLGPAAELALGQAILRPDHLFGETLQPLVSLAVGVILYEGGLSMRLHELREYGHVLRNLVSAGAVVSWFLAAAFAYLLGLLPFELALLLGAILVVTGPTVIGPLLRNIRLQGPAAPLLKWEGIVIDPIGATLAVLVFEAVQPGNGAAAPQQALLGFVKTALVGTITGALGALLLSVPLRRHWIPDSLENGASLALMAVTFTLSNSLQHESGLLAVTLMGFVVANTVAEQHVRHIVEFKENLRDILIPGLFVVLAAYLQASDLQRVVGWRLGAFLLLLILIVRPASVFVSTLGSKLGLRERALLACIAPRGIVAAAVSSIFALALVKAGHEEARTIPALTFAVIVVTVSVYSLLAVRLAPALGLSQKNPQGLLILGAAPWIRAMAKVVQEEGVPILLVDKNFSNVTEARLQGLKAINANALSDYALEELPLGGLGRLLALTPNDEVNSLAAQRYAEAFGRSEVYQLPPKSEGSERYAPAHKHPVRYVFADDLTYQEVAERYGQGAQLKATAITEEFSVRDWDRMYGASGTKLFLIGRQGGDVRLFTTDRAPPGAPGDTLVALVSGSEAAEVARKKGSRRMARRRGKESQLVARQEAPTEDDLEPTSTAPGDDGAAPRAER